MLLRRRLPVRAASIMGPRGWEVMRRSTDNYFITRGGVYKCACSLAHLSRLCVQQNVPCVQQNKHSSGGLLQLAA